MHIMYTSLTFLAYAVVLSTRRSVHNTSANVAKSYIERNRFYERGHRLREEDLPWNCRTRRS